jgi:hypothetical protein
MLKNLSLGEPNFSNYYIYLGLKKIAFPLYILLVFDFINSLYWVNSLSVRECFIIIYIFLLMFLKFWIKKFMKFMNNYLNHTVGSVMIPKYLFKIHLLSN